MRDSRGRTVKEGDGFDLNLRFGYLGRATSIGGTRRERGAVPMSEQTVGYDVMASPSTGCWVTVTSAARAMNRKASSVRSVSVSQPVSLSNTKVDTPVSNPCQAGLSTGIVADGEYTTELLNSHRLLDHPVLRRGYRSKTSST